MNSGQALVILAGIVIVGVAALILAGAPAQPLHPGGAGPSPAVPGGPEPLPAVEVRSYMGTDLSSVNDFHENSIKGPQYISEPDYRLTVTGLTNSTDVYTYQEVLGQYPNYTKLVTLHCVEGWDVTILWEGVEVRDIIRHAGIDPRANTVVFRAHDGYTTSFPLSYVMDRDIIMAYKMNNITLPAERGYPFELVAEDKWGYKWIKWIDTIELTGNADYRGYWETRGYSNTGNLNQSFFF